MMLPSPVLRSGPRALPGSLYRSMGGSVLTSAEASMLIAQGESAKYVCDQMGHSGIQVTFDTYGHLFPQARQEASRKLEQAMLDRRREVRVERSVEIEAVQATPATASKRQN